MKKFGIVLLILIGLAALIYSLRDSLLSSLFSPTSSSIPNGISLESLEQNPSVQDIEQPVEPVKVIAGNLSIPWDIAFLPDGDMLVTERPGTLLKISLDGNETVIDEIQGVAHVGEGGLLGIALHPNFEQNNFVYLYLTSRANGALINRIERYTFSGTSLSERDIILDNIPGAQYHDGGKIAFGPDGFLYVTTGDATNEAQAQQTDDIRGKILRLTENGEPAPNNPFDNAIYSYGHRNPQGIVWDDEGRLWSSEHGPSGAQSGFDELNLIQPGNNYGWPTVRGDETGNGFTPPVAQSGADETWAPGGIAYWNGSLFFSGLRGESLYEARIVDSETIELTSHFREEFGRLRAVQLGPDDMLYITTSNTDGRGTAQEGDDKLIRIDPRVFR